MSNANVQRPNVLCLVTDQQRHDHLGCAGNPIIQTPNIDRLARSGIRFERCYVNNPICMPSRATMWTGQSANAHHVRCNGMPLDHRIPTIASALAEAGYRTHGVGKFHLSPFRSLNGADPASLNPMDWPESKEMWVSGRIGALPAPYYGLQSVLFVGGHGDFFWGDYRRWLMHEALDVIERIETWVTEMGWEDWETMGPSLVPAELHHSRWIADRVIEFLREQTYTGQPFFCWCSFPDPHHPYHAPEPYHSMYDPADMPVPARREGELDDLPPHFRRIQHEHLRVEGVTGPVTRLYEHTPEIMARTYGMISNVDANIGRVLDALEELGLRENTLVVYLSDHGDLMGDHWLQQKGPFHFDGLIRVPFIWSWPGHIIPNTVNTSIVSLLDFAPTILDLCGVPIPEGLRPEEPFLPLELPPWPGHSLRPILEGREKAVRDTAFIEHDEDCLGLRLRTLVTERYRLTWYAGQPYGELFDLQEDPQELHNLWDDPAYRPVRDELTAQLLDQVIMSDSRLPRRLSRA
ncbi:MAG TPA: sulfatase-like hydrolase/transferase [Caldilineae bacterium]|nr:sulfatase-like hydrolase/transferase [Caldilineae bacterium]